MTVSEPNRKLDQQRSQFAFVSQGIEAFYESDLIFVRWTNRRRGCRFHHRDRRVRERFIKLGGKQKLRIDGRHSLRPKLPQLGLQRSVERRVDLAVSKKRARYSSGWTFRLCISGRIEIPSQSL